MWSTRLTRLFLSPGVKHAIVAEHVIRHWVLLQIEVLDSPVANGRGRLRNIGALE